MYDCRTSEVVRVGSDSEVLLIFVTLYSESSKINISERHKIIKIWGGWVEKVSKK
jgi:hypothetical protein